MFVIDLEFLETMYLTIKLSLITTLILIPIGLALGYYLSTKNTFFKLVIEVLTWMPLVLPPTVLGFYFLIVFAPNSFLGNFFQKMNFNLVFNFYGLVLASVIFSLPFMVNPIKNAFLSLPSFYSELGSIYGKSKFYMFFRIYIPNIIPSIILGSITSFAHTLGEFGVVSMIGGDKQGETKVASIALFNEWEAGNFKLANEYALTLFLISFILLMCVIGITKKSKLI